MKQKFIQLSFTIAILFIVYITNTSFSGGISGQSTAGCTCHGAAAPATLVTVTSSPAVTSYLHGTAYNFTVNVSNPTQVAGGFNLTCNIGTITSVGAGVQIFSPTEIGHNAPKPFPATFNFTWTAPASGNTDLQFNVAGNAVNLLNANAGDLWNFGTVAAIPLPVTFSSFNVIKKNNLVELTWTTSYEEHIDRFDVERSSDGTNFTSIGSVNATNNIDGSTYSFTESIENLSPISNKYYYRINEIDIDKKNHLSETKFITLDMYANEVTIFPNIISNHQLNIIGTDISKKYSIQLMSLTGSIIYAQHLTNSTITLPKNIMSGVYFAIIKDGNYNVTKSKLIIQ